MTATHTEPTRTGANESIQPRNLDRNWPQVFTLDNSLPIPLLDLTEEKVSTLLTLSEIVVTSQENDAPAITFSAYDDDGNLIYSTNIQENYELLLKKNTTYIVRDSIPSVTKSTWEPIIYRRQPSITVQFSPIPLKKGVRTITPSEWKNELFAIQPPLNHSSEAPSSST